MGFEDRDWYKKEQKAKARLARAADRPPRFTPLRIALGLLAAATLAFAGLGWIVHSRSEAAAELKLRSQPNVLHETQIEGKKLQLEAEGRDAARRAQTQQQDVQRLQTITAQQQAEEEARRLETEAVDRKAKAWEKFYRKPAVCNDANTMDCANAYIRAKRTFEEKYARGEL
ncbi:MAG: hypothetical protein ABI433_11450 [Burkholderiaceae bacterium]